MEFHNSEEIAQELRVQLALGTLTAGDFAREYWDWYNKTGRIRFKLPFAIWDSLYERHIIPKTILRHLHISREFGMVEYDPTVASLEHYVPGTYNCGK